MTDANGSALLAKTKKDFLAVVRGIPITENHVTTIINTVSQISMLEAQKGVAVMQSRLEIQRITKEFEVDAQRCDRAVVYLEKLMDRMTDEEVSKMAQEIIQKILKG